MRRAAPVAVAVALLSAAPLPARAEPHALSYDLRTDAAITATGWSLYLGAELAKAWLAPSTCRFCDPNALDAGARDALAWSSTEEPKLASDLLAFAVVPAGMLAHQLLAARAAGDVDAGAVDVLLVLEAAAIAMDVNQLVKLSVGRERPFVHDGAGPGRPADPDDDLSFYSGHTSFAFAVAAAAGTISDLRGYDSAPWVWGVGLTVAAATGYLRVAADRHYLTDVLVGAATGLAAGIALPRLLHPREEAGASGASIAVVPFPLGVAIAF